MATSFDEVIDLTVISFKDYKLNKLYAISEEDFKTVMRGYLLKAIPKFTNCKKDLEDIDLVNKVFNNDLTLTEQVILSDYTVIEWMTPQILDITQMELHLNSTDFKHYSEQQNLKGKLEVQNVLRERVNQDTTNYGLKNIPWNEWASGVFNVDT